MPENCLLTTLLESFMRSGYKILWTDHALSELKQTIEYLETHWTERDLQNFASKLDHTIELISKSPELFPLSLEKDLVRRAVVEPHNTLYYRIKEETVEILSLFANLQHPKKKKL